MASLPSRAADVIHQRGGLPSLSGRVTKVDDAGVTLQRDSDRNDFIRWDFVRDVQMDHPDPALTEHLESALNLWRARTRLERRDTILAEPLFERLFETYRGQTHETALVVAEGLLRCRLAHGEQDMAVIPALEAIRLRRAINTATTVYSTLPPVLDDQRLLCTDLPPVWVMSTGLLKLEHDLATYHAGTDTVVAGMASLYLEAVRRQLGIRHDETQRIPGADHPGVAFLQLIVDAGSADTARRNAARQSLQRDISAASSWMQAWSYYFIGMSQMTESGIGRREQGQVSLAHVPARFGASQPFLAGLALAKLAEACDASGDTAAAASLRGELATRYPSHPVQRASRKSVTAGRTAAPALDRTSPNRKESP